MPHNSERVSVVHCEPSYFVGIGYFPVQFSRHGTLTKNE